MIVENALIAKADLGIEDHGIFTCDLRLDGGGWGQGFGGYALDEWNPEAKRRVGTAEGMEFILQLLRTFEVSYFGELTGLYCRVEREHFGGKITRIGHITKDRWFDPEVVFGRKKAA